MASEIQYRQCVLEREDRGPNGGVVTTVSWLPERHRGVQVTPGVRVSIRDPETGDEVPGVWIVKSVSADGLPESVVKDRAHNWDRSRKVSDI